MLVKAFITHKLSEKYKDCQDRFSLNAEKFTVAVSDGMSESIFPHYWAEILSNAYVEEKFVPNNGVGSLCSIWHDKVSDFIEVGKKKKTLHWRTEANFLEGKSAGATLCGVKFKNSSKWNGHVLGDSCLITINENKIEEIYSSEDKPFDSYPDFYDSNPKNSGRGTIREVSGEITQGKRLLLVSDPFSEYLSLNRNNADALVSEILSLNSHEEFCQLVERWRKNGMHNDDSTLIIIDWDGRKSFNIKHMDDINSLIQDEIDSSLSSESAETKKTSFESKVSKEASQVVEEVSSAPQNNKGSVFVEEVQKEEPITEKQKITIEEQAPPNAESSSPQKPVQNVLNFEESPLEPNNIIEPSKDSTNAKVHQEKCSNEQNSGNGIGSEKRISIHPDYVVALLNRAMKEIEIFFTPYRNRNKRANKKLNKQLNPNDVYKKCINVFEDLISKIDQLEK